MTILTKTGRQLATAAFASLMAPASFASEPADSLNKELQEIVVAAKQPATRLEGSTLVSTIAGSRLQDIGTCLDALAQLPMIAVNDGEVTVTGKGAPEIYIDGRPMRDGDELRQLQSSNIRKVELLLSPGAMYDSDTKAVLKISTRKNFVDGLSLSERVEVTAKRRWDARSELPGGGLGLFRDRNDSPQQLIVNRNNDKHVLV